MEISSQENVINHITEQSFSLIDIEDAAAAQEKLILLIKEAFHADDVALHPPDSTQEQDSQSLLFSLSWGGEALGHLRIVNPALQLDEQHFLMLNNILSGIVHHITKYAAITRKLNSLNTYLSVSTNIHNNINLGEQLQWVIYLCTNAVDAAAGSVLLLTQDEQSLEFYAVEGDKSEALSKFTMPADKGIAGFVLREKKPVIVNDCRSNPYFYDQIDSKTDFTTKNMIAAPLIAGEETIGVIEVINKNNDMSFSKHDADLVMLIANEVSYAVRNARIFEYVVTTYCKILQGQSNCHGCKRPLRSWTPCRRQINNL